MAIPYPKYSQGHPLPGDSRNDCEGCGAAAVQNVTVETGPARHQYESMDLCGECACIARRSAIEILNVVDTHTIAKESGATS